MKGRRVEVMIRSAGERGEGLGKLYRSSHRSSGFFVPANKVLGGVHFRG